MSNATKQGTRERPILFKDELVLAILEGRKTVTRRPVKDQRLGTVEEGVLLRASPRRRLRYEYMWTDPNHEISLKPLAVPGDRLVVRETWRTASGLDAYSPAEIGRRALDAGYRRPWAPLKYDADGHTDNADVLREFGGAWGKTRVSIHMPRWASRLLLEVTAVRVERVQAITEEDARAEGMQQIGTEWTWNGGLWLERTARDAFRAAWDSIYGSPKKDEPDLSWAANPWVWVVSFARRQP